MLFEAAKPVAPPDPVFSAGEDLLEMLAGPASAAVDLGTTVADANQAHIESLRIPEDDFQNSMTTDTRFHLTFVGRSGFDSLVEGLQFEDRVADEMSATMEHVASLGLSDRVAVWTSSTDGIVDRRIKKMRDWGFDCYAVHCPSLEVYVNPSEEIAVPTYVTTDKDYSLATLAMTHGALVCFPGGPWALFDDVPAAIAMGKHVLLADMKEFDEFTSQGRINNHVRHLLVEKAIVDAIDPDQLDAIVAEDTTRFNLTRKLVERANDMLASLGCERNMTPQKMWRLFQVLPEKDRGEHLAKYVREHLPEVPASDQDITTRVQNASVRLAVSGIGFRGSENMTLDEPARRRLVHALEIVKSRGVKPHQLAFYSGVQQGGMDHIVHRLSRDGHPNLKIASEVEWNNMVANQRVPESPVVVVEGRDPWKKAQVWLGVDQRFARPQALLLFEGDERCLPLIKSAVDLGIPVWVMRLSSKPLMGITFDHTTFNMTQDSVGNIAEYVSYANRARLFQQVCQKIVQLNVALRVDPAFPKQFDPNFIARFLARCQGLLQKSRARLESLPSGDTYVSGLRELVDLIERLSFLLDEKTTREKNPHIHLIGTSEELAELIMSQI